MSRQEEPADPEFGRRFRLAWRNSQYRDLLQAELAKRYDYSQQAISTLANGHRYPHLTSGLRFAKDFNVTLDWLYTGREPMRPVLDPSPYTNVAHRLMSLRLDQLQVIDLLGGLLLEQAVSVNDVMAFINRQQGLRSGSPNDPNTLTDLVKKI